MKNYKIIVSIHAWPQMKPMKGWDSKMEQTWEQSESRKDAADTGMIAFSRKEDFI
jgi:hypothetical protein